MAVRGGETECEKAQSLIEFLIELVDASRSGDAPKVRRLLSLGFLDIGPGSAWPNFTPLGRAAFKGQDEVIRILLGRLLWQRESGEGSPRERHRAGQGSVHR